MSENEHTRSPSFDAARAAFDELNTEDRAAFLLEATLRTVGHGLEEAGKSLAHIVDQLFHTDPDSEQSNEASMEPEPAKKPTSRTKKTVRAPRKKAKPTRAKKQENDG